MVNICDIRDGERDRGKGFTREKWERRKKEGEGKEEGIDGEERKWGCKKRRRKRNE